jgi:hypothetical protein
VERQDVVVGAQLRGQGAEALEQRRRLPREMGAVVSRQRDPARGRDRPERAAVAVAMVVSRPL